MMHFLAALALLFAHPVIPLDDRAPIDDATFLVGEWQGEGMGGEVQESWSPPVGGQMIGHFSYARDGIPQFYEILLIRPDANGDLEMLVKHFDADFTAWEDKGEWVTFEGLAERRTAGALRFNGLSIELGADGVLTSTVTMRRADGSVSQVPFVMKRVQ